MNFALCLWMLAASPVPLDQRHPEAVEIFHSGFEEASDSEYDGWPDGWTRKRGPKYPVYLPARIVQTPVPEGKSALRIDLNGGAATIYSPAIEVRPLFSYVLEGWLRTEGLKHDRAWLSVTFFDEQRKELGHFESQHVGSAEAWTKLRLGPLAPPSDRARIAVVGLHLEPGAKADLKGAALFDDIWFARLPRMTLSSNSLHNVYTDPSQIEITCRVSGIFDRDPEMQFELVDISSQKVDGQRQRIDGQVVAKKLSPASQLLGQEVTQAEGFAGSTTWKPEVTAPGFYRVLVNISGQSGTILERELTLAVVNPAPIRAQGEFGWSLPQADTHLSLTALGQLLPQVGISWAKYPVWFDDSESQRLDQIVTFAERLAAQRIETVGLLANPPAEVRAHFGGNEGLTAADVFTSDPSIWYRSLEPVLTRLSLQMRWWQLGLDGDVSFVGYPQLAETISKLKQRMQSYGQEIHLGFGWRIFNQPPAVRNPPWEFLALTASPSLTAEELKSYLPALAAPGVARWVEIQPLERGTYCTEARACDLIHRLLAAKIAGAEAIFVPRPFDPESGLMNDNGTPSELLLPWRTTALAVSGSEYLGSMQLPGGSQNHIFVRGGEVTMVVWNDRPIDETLFLGENVQQTDMWGRTTPAGQSDSQQVIHVDRLPTFVSGLSEPVVRWTMAVQFEHSVLPSVCGVPHENAFTIKNFFPLGVGGQVRLVAPDVWRVAPREIDFKLSAGEVKREPFTITLPFDAVNGRQPVRIDFDLSADRHYQFSVYRHIDMGLDDLKLEVSSRLNDQGELEVVQQITNHTADAASFKCLLFAPNRRRKMSQVIELRQDRDTKIYRFANGAELIGQSLLLRAEEIGGQRTLNYRFTAEK